MPSPILKPSNDSPSLIEWSLSTLTLTMRSCMTWPPTFCPDLLLKSFILKSPVLPQKHPLSSYLWAFAHTVLCRCPSSQLWFLSLSTLTLNIQNSQELLPLWCLPRPSWGPLLCVPKDLPSPHTSFTELIIMPLILCLDYTPPHPPNTFKSLKEKDFCLIYLWLRWAKIETSETIKDKQGCKETGSLI